MAHRLTFALVAGTCVLTARLDCQSSAPDGRGSVRAGQNASVTLSGLLQVDARIIARGGTASGPILRRAEIILEAATHRGFGLRLQPDFGQGRVLVQDAFVRWQGGGNRRISARAGRFRPAFGTERMRSSSTLLFPERGLVNSFMPARATGLDVRVSTTRFTWQVGLFQPPVAATASLVDTDGDLERTPTPRQEGLARIEWRAIAPDSGELRLHIGVIAGGATPGGETVTQPSRLLTIGQRPAFAYRASGPDLVSADGDRWRADVGLQRIGGRVAWHIEVVETEEGMRWHQIERLAVKHHGVGAAWSIVRGGRRASNSVITPTAARGALEWGLRAGLVQVDDVGRDLLAEPGSAARARGAGVAVAWLPSAATRMSVSYDQTRLDRGHQHTEHAVMLRVQQMF